MVEGREKGRWKGRREKEEGREGKGMRVGVGKEGKREGRGKGGVSPSE